METHLQTELGLAALEIDQSAQAEQAGSASDGVVRDQILAPPARAFALRPEAIHRTRRH